MHTKSPSLEEDLGEVLCDWVENTCHCRGFCNLSVENLIREREMEMTRDSQVKVSEEEKNYKENMQNARALELAKFKMVEFRERLNRLEELL